MTSNFFVEQDSYSDNMIGCNFSVRASILGRTGLFDEEFIGNANKEDSDMAVRVRECGYLIRYLPDAVISHKHFPEGGCRSETDRIQWYYCFFYNSMLFYTKHAQSWRIPFFFVYLSKTLVRCWLLEGRGRMRSLVYPMSGLLHGVKAARRSMELGAAVARSSSSRRIF